MVEFIKKKVHVQDPDASTTHKKGSGLERKPINVKETNLFFIGPRGSGKSTVAEAVAARQDLPFVDTDSLIQEEAGLSIAQIVQEQGWPAFRKLEAQALKEVCAGSGQVVATGGGIVLDADNRTLLREHGQVFYLMADAPLLHQRLAAQDDASLRPPLTDLEPAQELAETLAEREPLYFQTLHYILPANRQLDELVQDVLERLGQESDG